MKTLVITDEDAAMLKRLKNGLLAGPCRSISARITESPVFCVFFGKGDGDPDKRLNAVCFTDEEAEALCIRERHHGPMFIWVASCNRAPLSKWLLQFVQRIETQDCAEPHRQKELFR